MLGYAAKYQDIRFLQTLLTPLGLLLAIIKSSYSLKKEKSQ